MPTARRRRYNSASPTRPRGKGARLKLQELQELIGLLRSEGVTEFELEEKGVKLRLKRAFGGGNPTSAAPPAAAPKPAAPANHHVIKSPIVGVFYRAASPNAPAFVDLGQRVRVGQTLCIVEAMKLMNEIAADAEGLVAAILVENGQPVEYGQPLFQLSLTG